MGTDLESFGAIYGQESTKYDLERGPPNWGANWVEHII